MDKIKKVFLENKFYFFPTFRKITVEGFVNQLIKIFWPWFCIDVIKVLRQKIDFAWSTLIKKVPNIKITEDRVYFKDDPIRIEQK